MILKKENAEGYPKLLYLDSEDPPESEVREISRAIAQIATDEAIECLCNAVIKAGAEEYGLAYGNLRSARILPYKNEIRRQEDMSRAKTQLKKIRDFFLYSNIMALQDIDPVSLMKKIEKNVRYQQRYLGGYKNAGNQNEDRS